MTLTFIRNSRYIATGGTLFIWLTKLVIRPSGIFDHTMVAFFFGIVPNLVGAFVIPFFASWLFVQRPNRFSRFFPVHHLPGLRWFCLQCMALLIINEYLQLIRFFGRTFDYYDILFSAAGLLAAYFVFMLQFQRVAVMRQSLQNNHQLL